MQEFTYKSGLSVQTTGATSIEAIRQVVDRGYSIAELCRKERINQNLYYRCAGDEALTDKHPGPNRAWNQLPESRQTAVVDGPGETRTVTAGAGG